MSLINVCFSLKSYSDSNEQSELLEKDYQTIYKPIAKFLYSHSDFCFSFCISGIQLQYLKKKRGEFISICRELANRKQVEIIGGAYYNSILPLLYSVDRNGQIDLLSAEIRQNFGKRPRGMSLFADCWDSTLVNNLQTCGIEYVLLDSCIIPPAKRKFLPLIMSDLGKTVEIFPYYDSLIPEKNTDPQLFVNELLKIVEKNEKKESTIQLETERVVNINFSHEKMAELLENNWFEKLNDYLVSNPDCNIKTTIPSDVKRTQLVTVPAYISGGINNTIAKWITQTYNEIDFSKQKVPYTVNDFMENYSQSSALYNRLMYISMLVNQYKKDKVRKKSARDKLWQAQNGTNLICTSKGTFSNSKDRQRCYKLLNEAEKILRECEDPSFTDTLSCFDYNGDGLKEYVCRMKNYFSYITLKGGSVQELEVLKNGANYVDNFSRIEQYDNYSDDYLRGLFIDHIFTVDQFKHYTKGETAGDGIFSRVQYKEVKVNNSKHEIQLIAEAIFKPKKQKIVLLKKYIINSNGMTVQYILRNESATTFKNIFAVESNLSHTNYDRENTVNYTMDIIDSGKKYTYDNIDSKFKLNSSNQLTSVYQVRLNDIENGISFDFEPNETCNYCMVPITYKRPEFYNKELKAVGLTYCSTLFWNVEIEPGMETEKSINFTISSIKKNKKEK